jgi:hypothetical protein
MKKSNLLKIGIFIGLLIISFTSYSQVYARLEREDDTFHYYDSYYEHEVYDWYIRFYSDAACTTPVTLTSNIALNFHQDFNLYYAGHSYPDTFDGPIGASIGDGEIYLYDKYVRLVDWDGVSNYYYASIYTGYYELRSGTGYIVVPPNY